MLIVSVQPQSLLNPSDLLRLWLRCVWQSSVLCNGLTGGVGQDARSWPGCPQKSVSHLCQYSLCILSLFGNAVGIIHESVEKQYAEQSGF